MRRALMFFHKKAPGLMAGGFSVSKKVLVGAILDRPQIL